MRNAQEIFSAFFAIPDSQLEADIAAAKERPTAFIDDFGSQRELTPRGRILDAKEEVAQLHARLLWGHALIASGRRIETAMFAVSLTALHFANHASNLASQRGEMAQLSREMGEIENRHGVDCFLIGEGPPDWERCQSASRRLLDEFEDMIVQQVLERYGFADLVELFERDRLEFDVSVEVGRRLNMESSASTDLIHDQAIEDRHGARRLALLRQRLRAEGLD